MAAMKAFSAALLLASLSVSSALSQFGCTCRANTPEAALAAGGSNVVAAGLASAFIPGSGAWSGTVDANLDSLNPYLSGVGSYPAGWAGAYPANWAGAYPSGWWSGAHPAGWWSGAHPAGWWSGAYNGALAGPYDASFGAGAYAGPFSYDGAYAGPYDASFGAGAYAGPYDASAYGYGFAPHHHSCVKHYTQRRVRPVVDECIRHVPVTKTEVSHKEDIITRQVPVVKKTVHNQPETFTRHVPVTKQNVRHVVEAQTTHVPVTKTRLVQKVEPYTVHVPVVKKFTRPVVERYTTSVPVTQTRNRPVVSQRVDYVPVPQRITRPVTQTRVVNVPVKHRVVKNLVEQTIARTHGPCDVCPPGTEAGLAYGDATLAGSYLPGDASFAGALPADAALPASGVYGGLAGSYLPGDASFAGALPAGDFSYGLQSGCSCSC